MMNLLKTLTLGLLLAAVTGCSYLNLDKVLPDKRTEYRDSRGLPPLEVPPDLTSDTINDSMEIPGEKTPNTLSAYERQQRDAAGGTALGGALENEDSLTLRGDRYTIWPKLKRFWQDRGYSLELDDAELGVIETGWSGPRDTAEGQVRDRYKVFAEDGSQADTTVLFISHDLQRRGSAGGEWVDAGSDAERRKAMTAELYNHFGGSQTSEAGRTASRESTTESSTNDEARSSLPRAEIVNNADGQVYMTLPQNLDAAWPAMEQAINSAGVELRASNQEDGEFIVAYMPPQREEDAGWFDALKFWEDDGPVVYRLSLTGTGEATEVTVRDEDGEWQSTDEVRELLNRLQRQYNR